MKKIVFILILCFLFSGCASIKQWAGSRWRTEDDKQKQDSSEKPVETKNTEVLK